MADGHLNKCKECVKDRVNNYREQNIDAVREYDRDRSHSAKRQLLRTSITKKRRQEVTGYEACHNAVFRAIKKGTMVRSNTCQICGKQGKTEAHHNNYLEKLKVLWLCSSCHKLFHIGKNAKSDRIRLIVNAMIGIRDDTEVSTYEKSA
jgi:hypothetical protein